MYPKDKAFVKIYNEIDNNDTKTNIINEKPPLNTPFLEKREDVDRPTPYCFSGPFEVLQADIATFDFWVSPQPIKNIAFCLLICSLL